MDFGEGLGRGVFLLEVEVVSPSLLVSISIILLL